MVVASTSAVSSVRALFSDEFIYNSQLDFPFNLRRFCSQEMCSSALSSSSSELPISARRLDGCWVSLSGVDGDSSGVVAESTSDLEADACFAECRLLYVLNGRAVGDIV